MERFVITIARENGSGGRMIGESLAKYLNVPFYNRALLRLASDESGISEQLFAKADEDVRRTHLFRVARDALRGEVIPPDSDDFVSNENLFRYQARIILELARTENCVIIGRCADYILRDIKPWRLFVYADMDSRIRRCYARAPEGENLSDKEMRQKILSVDKGRQKYYEFYTGNKWGDMTNYDFCINTSNLIIKDAIPHIAHLFD